MKKRILSLTALLLVLCLAFGACGTSDTSADPTPADTAAEDPAPEPEPAAEEPAPAADSEPVAADPAPADASAENVTLDVTTMRWGTHGETFTQNPWLIAHEEASGVTINWNAVSSEGWPEARNLLLLSGDLPDVFIGNMTIEDGNVLANLDKFMDLTPLIESSMPKYQNALATIPALKQITTYPDGKIYSLAKNLPARPMTRIPPR